MRAVFQKHDFDFLFTCGYAKLPSQVKLTDVRQLVRTVWLHYVKFNPRVELEELRKGICETLALNTLISSYADCMWKLLVSSNTFNVTPSYLQDKFVIHYSPEGSNKRIEEEAIVFSWYDYVSECEGAYPGLACKCSIFPAYPPGYTYIPIVRRQSHLNLVTPTFVTMGGGSLYIRPHYNTSESVGS